MILKIADWEFDIDMERTMAYSAAEAAEHCDCAYCRNFYAAVDFDCPALRIFLAQFGIDVEAPDELMPYDKIPRPEGLDNLVLYSGKYVVFGRIVKYGETRFALGAADLWPSNDTEFDFEEPYFVIALEESEIRWVLDEPFEEVISPANEPSFLKKMWDRLLGRAKKNNVDS